MSLRPGRIVIVAGFQGASDDFDVTTLGRGGSDTTAVALAAALRADRCEIYTDVAGVYSADPRICPRARPLRDIGYEEMLELAATGARVVHARAVEVGALYGVPILVASTFDSEAPGTLIHEESTMEQGNKVRGIAHEDAIAKITVRGVPDRPGVAAQLFTPLADAGVSVDTIVQNASVESLTDMTFTVDRGDAEPALRVVESILPQLEASEVVVDADLGSVSIVGTGMSTSPGFAARMFRTLFEHGINIELISTSEIRITCIVRAAAGGRRGASAARRVRSRPRVGGVDGARSAAAAAVRGAPPRARLRAEDRTRSCPRRTMPPSRRSTPTCCASGHAGCCRTSTPSPSACSRDCCATRGPMTSTCAICCATTSAWRRWWP